MRISDWSSDVCSSDLLSVALYRQVAPPWLSPAPLPCVAPTFLDVVKPRRGHLADSPSPPVSHADRKTVVYGKSVSVRVDLGGRRILNKQKQHTHNRTTKRSKSNTTMSHKQSNK